MLRGDDEPVAAGDRNTPGGQSAKQRGKLIGSRSADFILAREVRLAPTQAVDMTAFDRRGAPISSLRGGGRPDMAAMSVWPAPSARKLLVRHWTVCFSVSG